MNKTIDEQNTTLIEGQLISSIFLLFSVAVSILLFYDSLKKSEKKEGLFGNDEAYQILIIYRISFVIIFGYLLYNNYQNLQLRKQQNRDLRPSSLQLLSAIFAVAATITSIYVDLTYKEASLTTAEEPTL